jgi:hypothetical protein
MIPIKSLAQLFGSALCTLPLVISTHALAEDLTFSLDNQTNATLVDLYISPSSANHWEQDLISTPADEVQAGQKAAVTISDGRRASGGPRTCIYDILGVFADGQRRDAYKIDFCNLDTYTFQ